MPTATEGFEIVLGDTALVSDDFLPFSSFKAVEKDDLPF